MDVTNLSWICHTVSPKGTHKEELKCWEAEVGVQADLEALFAEDGLHASWKGTIYIFSYEKPVKEVSTPKLTTITWLFLEAGRIAEQCWDDILMEFCNF